MKTVKTKFDSVILIYPDVYVDDRGYFMESYKDDDYKSLGIEYSFVQDNISSSKKDTIRGIHFQKSPYMQGKLCSVIYGRIVNVVVDIRETSPTFGEYISVELNDIDRAQLWIPPGFAHGFGVLSDYAIFSQKCTTYYNSDYESIILYNDLDLGVEWKIESPILSIKDAKGKTFYEHFNNNTSTKR